MPSIFTQIMNGDMPGHIVWSDDVCMAFLTIAPLKPADTLSSPAFRVTVEGISPLTIPQ